MKPWFENELIEADIIDFPKPKAKVIRMPNVQEYPDFITGVSDLQAKQKDGTISQETYNKLYTDLIHRFMKKESFETPWYLRESTRGILYRIPGVDKFHDTKDPNKFIIFQKAISFPQRGNFFNTPEEMQSTIDGMMAKLKIKNIHWFNNPVRARAFSIAEFIDNKGKKLYFGRYWQQLTGTPQQRTNRWQNTDFRNIGYQLDKPASRKAGYGLKPQLVGLTPDQTYRNPNQIISQIKDPALANPLKLMPRSLPSFNVDIKMKEAIRDDFGEVFGPMAIWHGMNIGPNGEQARKFYLGNAKWATCSILFPGKQNEGLIDSVLRPQRGVPIGISSKGAGGSRPSIKNLMESIKGIQQKPTTGSKKLLKEYKGAIDIIMFLGNKSAIDGPIQLALKRNLINSATVQAFENAKNKNMSKKDQALLTKMTKHKPSRTKPILFYHAVAGVARLVMDSINQDKRLKFSEACIKFLNSSPIIQLYTDADVVNNQVKVTGFRSIWPPQFKGTVRILDRMYQTNKKPGGKLSFDLDPR